MDPRPFLVGLAVAAGLGLFVLTAGALFFYSLTVERNPKTFLGGGPTPAMADAALWLDSQNPANWRLKSFDGIDLVASWVPAGRTTADTVILAHGYGSRGRNMALYARFYHGLGFNVLIPDDRAHGASGGSAIGFGWLDRKDYLGWIGKVLGATGDGARIVLHGVSMGAATVMMVSGEALPPQVRVLVEDCGYTAVADELAFQLGQMYHLPAFPLVEATSVLTQLRAGYGFFEASSVVALKKNRLPLLFIHGDQDTFVPTAMVHNLFEACTAGKELYIVPGAGHAMAYETDPAAYEARVTDFLHRYF